MLRAATLVSGLLLIASSALGQAGEGATGLSRPAPHPSSPGTSLPTPTQGAPQNAPESGPLPNPTDAARGIYPAAPPLPSPVSADGNVEARLDALDGHLTALAARRTSNIGGSVVSMLMGGTFIGLGVYASRNGGDPISGYFYLTGAASVASAGLQIGLQPNQQRAYDRLQAIRLDPTLDPAARLARAEPLLGNMARRRMASRYLQGMISLGMTVGALPILLGGDGFRTSESYDWLIALSAGIGLIDAMTTMFQRSEEERRWRMYLRFAGSHGGQAVFSEAPTRLRFSGVSAIPLPNGTIGAATFRF